MGYVKKVRLYELNSFEELLKMLQRFDIPKDGKGVILFRGQGNCKWSLTPSIVRKKKPGDVLDTDLERKVLNEFKHLAKYVIDKTLFMQNDLQYLTYMQHYGISTRLLDWTENPILACWFAIDQYVTEQIKFQTALDNLKIFRSENVYPNVEILDDYENSIITAMDSLKPAIWGCPVGRDDIISSESDISSESENDPLKIEKISFVRPLRFDQRILSQKSWFSIHPIQRKLNKHIDLDQCDSFFNKGNDKGNYIRLCDEEDNEIVQMVKYVLSVECTKGMYKFTKNVGVDEFSVYPDVVGIVKYIKRVFLKEV